MLLREAAYTQDRCFAMLSFITGVLRQEELEQERKKNEENKE